MAKKRGPYVIHMLFACVILMGYPVTGYSQQTSTTIPDPEAQKPAKPSKLPERPPRYPTALAGLELLADLSVSPAAHTGPCPALLTFRGKISVNRPATVHYRFVRSDNTRTKPEVLTFEEAGTKEVTDTWRFENTARAPTFSGWEAIQVSFPMKAQSNVAYFTGSCTP